MSTNVELTLSLDEKNSVENFDALVEKYGLTVEEEADTFFIKGETDATLDEVKASFGVDAEVADPVGGKAKAPGGEKEKAESDPKKQKKQGSSDEKVASVPKNKVDMINKIADAVKGMKKEDLGGNFAQIMVDLGYEEYADLVESEKEDKTVTVSELKKITAEDIDISEDIKAIFGEDETLSEDFISKATTIFEAAVVAKVNETIEKITIDIESDREADIEALREELSANLDKYLEYVAEEWMKENELAIEQGIRAEVVENFMAGMHNLFTENYIDIPEEKADLVEELVAKNEELEEQVNSGIEKNIELTKELTESKKATVFAKVSESLAETQVEKLQSLAEGVEFESEEDYKEKLEVVKENYFPADGSKGKKVNNTTQDLDEELDLDDDNEEEKIDPLMATYMASISKTVKKA